MCGARTPHILNTSFHYKEFHVNETWHFVVNITNTNINNN